MESVCSSSHAAGSAAPLAQTLAANDVGLVPATRSFTRTNWPGPNPMLFAQANVVSAPFSRRTR